MPCAYFVSDIHIMSPDSGRARAFLSFLKSLPGKSDVTHLVLLGDIFDLWVADHDYFIEAYRDIVAEIQRLKDDGVDIRYFEGNHDLHLKYFWRDRLGITVHEGPTYLQLGERTVRLEHGDQMDPEDRGYLFLRWFLRTPPVRFLIRHLPGRVVAHIGDRASAASRDYTSNTKTIDQDDAIDKIRAHAHKVHGERPFDLIISGHVHIRDDHQLESGNGRFRSVNLGSWLDAPCYFRIDGSGEDFHDLAVTT